MNCLQFRRCHYPPPDEASFIREPFAVTSLRGPTGPPRFVIDFVSITATTPLPHATVGLNLSQSADDEE